LIAHDLVGKPLGIFPDHAPVVPDGVSDSAEFSRCV